MVETITSKRPTPAFERHAQTVLVLVLVALLLWVGKTTQDTAVSIAEMRVELTFLKREVQQQHPHEDLYRRVERLEEENQNGKR